MRIIAGSAGGRRIESPPGMETRPITDRAKTAIFNMLVSIRTSDGHSGLSGLTVLDLFAGSGSFGLECLSRGADRAVFVERDGRAASVIARNLETLGFTGAAELNRADVRRFLAADRRTFDVAFCDPPYAADLWPELLSAIGADLLVAHAETALSLTEEWEELRRRSYGRPQIVIARRRPDGERTGSSS